MTAPITPNATRATATGAPSAPTGERAKLRQAAQAFEAIFVRQILATARATTFGNGLTDTGDQGRDTFTQMRDERFADIAAKSGAFGLAARIEAQLARALPAAPVTPTPATKEP